MMHEFLGAWYIQDGREELLKQLEEKKSLHHKLSMELERYKSCDPERVQELRECASSPDAAQGASHDFYLKEVHKSLV